MPNPRWTKVGRDLAAHKVRTLLVVLSIAVGIFAAAVMLGGRAILIRSLDTAFPASNPSSITFYTSPFDEHVVRAIQRDPDVLAAEGRHRVDLSFRVDGTGDWKSVTLVAVKDFRAITIDKLDQTPGTRWPRRGEVLMERSAADFAGVKVGDVVELETSGKRHPKLRVIGFVHDLNAVVPMMTGSVIGFVNADELPNLQEDPHFNQLEVIASPRLTTEADLSRLGKRLRDHVLADRGVIVGRTNLHTPGVHYIADIFKAISLLLSSIGLLTLFLSGFLVVNTVSSLVTQQTRQIGVMKAVGARPRQLVVMYFAMVVTYGLAALALAIPLGQLGSNAFVEFGAGKINFLVTDFTTPDPILAMELGVGLLVPLLAASVPVIAGMRMPVREALYSQGINTAEFGEGRLDRLLGRIRGLSRPIALALRNTFIRKGRLALTLTTLTLAAAVFMSVASVRSAIRLTVDRIGLHRTYDVWVDLAKERPSGELERQALQVRGITGAETWNTVSGLRIRPDRTESQNIELYGVPWDTAYFRPELMSGRWLRAGDKDAIVVDSGFVKDEPDVGVGSVVEIKANGVDKWWTVVGIVRGDFLNPFVYADRSQLDKALNTHGGTNMVVARTAAHTASYQKGAAKRVADHYTDKGLAVSNNSSQQELKQTITDSLNIIVVFLVIMAGLLVVVGGIGLSGTMSINVMESTREIGVMRAIGASNASIYQVFITEGLVVGVISWALGAVLAVPMSMLLTSALGQAMRFPLTWGFSFEGVAAWLGFVIVISVWASVLPAYRAARVSVAEAIAYE